MRTEAAQAEASAVSGLLANPLLEGLAAMPAQESSFATQRFDSHIDPMAAFFVNKKRSVTGNQAAQGYFALPNNSGSPMAQLSSPGPAVACVSNCYVFKSRLQEYAQKKGLPTPVYETIKEGPSHEPSFKSTVILNDVRYDSLPGFFNRKAAEQSAAEVALMELAKSDEVECISQPINETGLCKNLLQEYAQKMNYAIPLYQCQKVEAAGRAIHFKCTVEIGGIQYIGASAKTKKEAEIKAARIALLAIQSSASESSRKPLGNSQLTVTPSKKRGAENAVEEAANVPKAKKARFRKKILKKKFSRGKIDHNQSDHTVKLGVTMDKLSDNYQIEPTGQSDVLAKRQSGLEIDQTDAAIVQATTNGVLPVLAMEISRDEGLVHKSCNKETADVIGSVNQHSFECVSSTTVDCNQKSSVHSNNY